MSNYELWSKNKGESNFIKISEFKNYNEVDCRMDEVLSEGKYSEVIVIYENKFVSGKEIEKNKIKKKIK